MSSPTVPNHQLQNNSGSVLSGCGAANMPINTNALIMATPISVECESDSIPATYIGRASLNTPQRLNKKPNAIISNSSSSSTNRRHNIIVERTCGGSGSQTSPTSSAGSSQFIYNAQQDIQPVKYVFNFVNNIL